MKKFLIFGVILLSLFACRKPTKKIDITLQRILTGEKIPLQVTHISPVGSVEGTREAFKILIGFNQTMTALQAIPREETDGPLEFEPKIKGKYRWLGSRTLTFIPHDTLQPATRFKITLRKGKIQSLTGMRLERDTSWTFETVRPALISSRPYHGSDFIYLNTNIYLYFNMEMAPERVGDKIKMFANHGVPSYVWCGSKSPSYSARREELKFKVRHLNDSEKKDYPLKNWENKRTLVLTPTRPLPVEAKIEVQLVPGLLARHGNLGTTQDRILNFKTYNVFTLTNHSEEIPGGYALRLCFSNPVNTQEVLKNMKITPSIEIPEEYKEEDYTYNEISFYLPFKLNSTYNVALSNKIKDQFGNYLDRDYQLTVEIGDYQPYASIPTGINVVESKADLRLPATFRNFERVYLQMGLVDLEQAIPFLNQNYIFSPYKKFSAPGFFKVNRLWQVNTYQKYRNKRIRFPIELKEVLGSEKNGLVYIQLDKYGDYRYMKSFLEVGDLGVTWKYAPENNLVWVTSLNSTEPISNARVQFRDDKNRTLFEGYTDKSGFCELPGWASARLKEETTTYEYEDEYEMESYTERYEPKFWILVSKGTDQAIYSNRWDFGLDPWRFNISYNWYIRAEEYGATIFTEKGLYRSGETVHIKGMVRKKHKGEWVLPDLRRIIFVARDSRDEEIVTDTIQLNQHGSFTKKIFLAEDTPTGQYSIRVILPGKDYYFYEYFRVEAYRPAEFEVKALAEKDTFVAGETFKGKIIGRYLFGMGMKDAELYWNLSKDYYCPSYPMHKGYSFGGYYYDDDYGRDILGSGSGTLDQNGEYQVEARLAPEDLKRPSIITLEGTVTAPNKRSLSGRQNWVTFPASILIGLKSTRYLYNADEPVKIGLITITPSGTKIGNQKVNYNIVKREWKSIKKARLGGRYEWVSELVEKEIEKNVLTSRTDSVFVKFIPKEPGYYYLHSQAKDSKGRETSTRIYFYVLGKGYAGWEMRDDDIIELVPDKDKYEVGDTARILVKSPYDSAQALITVERELILKKFTKMLRGNADYIEIPIQGIDLPNIYVGVVLLRGRVPDLGWDEEKEVDLGKPQFKTGYVNLVVDAKEKHLVIKTHSDKSEYRPRDSVKVDFEVKDYRGKPVANSEVTLFVVDVGVLNLIDFSTPDPFYYFYGPRSLSVKTVESRLNVVGQRSYGEKGEDRGGGGAPAEAAAAGVSYREKFIATVFYHGSLKTDMKGKGKVKFELPDNLTKFRIMAVAQTSNSEFGSAESTFVVNLPFITTPSIPRFARVGDRFQGGVVLHNRSDKDNRARVVCQIEGLKLNGPKTKEILLPAKSSREVLFSFAAESIGTATFKFSAEAGKEKDAVKLTIPVKLPPFVEAVATFSSTPDSAIEAVIVPSFIYEDIGRLDILLSSTVLAGMQRGIEHLLDYPYGCLEQRLSRILPLIVGEDIINQFKLAPVTGKALRDTVQKVLDEVPDYQHYSGGFLYFKECIYPCPYLSAYTMYILKRAAESGYDVDRAAINKGIRYLKDVLRWGTTNWTYPYNVYARLTTRAFCIYSLSLWGERETGYASKLFEQREQIPVFGKTLLLKAGRNIGMGSRFEEELVRIINNKIKFSPTTAHFEEAENRGWTFPSPAKVTGFVIQTFTELEIPFAYKDQVIRWLVQERGKKSLPTTHENAFVFDAFQTYYKKFEQAEPNFVARIILGQKEILKETFKGRTNEPPRHFSYGLKDVPKDTLLPIRISKDGTGRLYFTLRMYYAFKENPIAFDEGFYLWKEILTLDGKEVKRYERGQIYKVILHIVVPETRIFAVVEDPLPAGFEPVQTFFATEASAVQEQYWEDEWREIGHWWGSFDHKEFYDDRTLLFAQELFPGEHTQVYYVRAGTSGEFLAPSAKAEEMYSPEVFGSTTQGFVTVVQ